MRPLVLIGLILAILGLAALAVPSITFFTTERVANGGFFTIDISKPHKIVFNPIVGGIALAAGVVLVLVELRVSSACQWRCSRKAKSRRLHGSATTSCDS